MRNSIITLVSTGALLAAACGGGGEAREGRAATSTGWEEDYETSQETSAESTQRMERGTQAEDTYSLQQGTAQEMPGQYQEGQEPPAGTQQQWGATQQQGTAQMPQQGMQQPGMQQQPGAQAGMQQGAMQGALMFRGGEGEEVEVREVVLRQARNGDQHLIFLREDVECSDLTRLPTRGNEQLVAMTQIRTETRGEAPQAGSLPASRWTMRVGNRNRTARGQEGWVRITNADRPDSIQGEVAINTEIRGDTVELSGPFTATLCDLSAESAQPRAQRETEQEGSEPTAQADTQPRERTIEEPVR